MPFNSPERTKAYVWLAEIFTMSATSDSVKKTVGRHPTVLEVDSGGLSTLSRLRLSW
jgi:hypothetical protein